MGEPSEKLNQAERFMAAGIVAPRLRAGLVSRSVKVVGPGGNVVREISGEQLGYALAERAGIELQKSPSPMVCPGCGGRKHPTSKRCEPCHRQAVRTRFEVCGCGSKKSIAAAKCVVCAGVAKNEKDRVCPGCGGAKSVVAKRCLPCEKIIRIASRQQHLTCGCGRPKDRKTARCAECRRLAGVTRQETQRLPRPKKYRDLVCACGGVKAHGAKRCRACFARDLRLKWEAINANPDAALAYAGLKFKKAEAQ